MTWHEWIAELPRHAVCRELASLKAMPQNGVVMGLVSHAEHCLRVRTEEEKAKRRGHLTKAV